MGQEAMTGDQAPLPRSGGPAAIAAKRVSELLRLANRLHRRPRDPIQRKLDLLDGLVAMTAAHRGACAVVHEGGGAAPVVLSAASRDPSDRNRRRRRRRSRGEASAPTAHVAGDPEIQAMIAHLTAAVREAASGGARGNEHAAIGASRFITALVRLDDDAGTFGALALSRADGHVPFQAEDHHLVHIFHTEMAWVYELDLPLASPEVISLSPRAKEVLQYLLGGFSEKQIAGRLKRSHNTVHHYVKQLYRHFGVSSRSELLARWARDEPGDLPGVDPPPRPPAQ